MKKAKKERISKIYSLSGRARVFVSWLCMALLSPSDPRLKSDTGGGRNSGEAAMIVKDELYVYKGCGGLKKAKKERGCAAKERISKLPPFAARKSSSIYRGIT